MTDIAHKRFTFDTVFDDRGGALMPPWSSNTVS